MYEMPSVGPRVPDLPDIPAGLAGPGATIVVTVSSERGGGGVRATGDGFSVCPEAGDVLMLSVRLGPGQRLRVVAPPGATTADSVLSRGHRLALALELPSVEAVARLASVYGVTADDARADDCYALRRACETGRRDVAEWLTETYRLDATDARSQDRYCLRAACRCGSLETAQWLTTRFALSADDARAGDNYCLRFACAGGHVGVVEWLVTAFALQADDALARAAGGPALSLAAATGRLEAARWLTERFALSRDRRVRALHAHETALRHQRPEAADWVRATFDPCLQCGALQAGPTCRDCMSTCRCAVA